MEDKKKPSHKHVQTSRQKEPLLPGQQPGLGPDSAEKFTVHPKSVVWHDPALQKAWEALHASSEEEDGATERRTPEVDDLDQPAHV